MMRTRNLITTALLGALLLGATACGGAAVASGGSTADPETPAADRCLPEIPGCEDVSVGDDFGVDFDAAPAREAARQLLGTAEADLPADVRVGRRGAEWMVLTEDYVLGRLTVELDDDGSGMRVVAVTAELPGGPEVVTAG